MITNQTNKPVESLGIQSETFFNVKQENLAFIFGILRNNLYSDKFLAILREYSANAKDAHAENGCPERPFVVTMPTALSPNLSIRDFGKGLSEEQVYNIFASYGASTKRETNDQIGGFGIGSKSAFCYVNGFTIVSIFEGKKSTYRAYIDETNIGKISRMGEPTDTDEESGLEIIVEIKQNDIHSFVAAGKSLFKHFNPKPIIVSCRDLSEYIANYRQGEVLIEGSDWSIVKRQNYGSSEAYCVMGDIHYPIQINKITSNRRGWVDSLYGSTINIVTPIGSVKMSASRESLEYDEATIDFLNKSVERIYAEACQMVTNELKNCKTLWEARIYLKEMDKIYGSLNVKAEWNGEPIKLPHVHLGPNSSVGAIEGISLIRRAEKTRNGDLKWCRCADIVPSKNVIIFTDNGTVKRNTLFSRINKYVADNNFGGVCVLAQFTTAEAQKEFETHEEIIGANIIDVETLAYVPPIRAKRVSTGARDKQKCSAFTYNGKTYASVKSQAWDPVEVNLANDGGVYVYIDKFLPVGFSGFGHLKKIIEALGELTNETIIVHGFRETKKTENLGSNWISLEDKIKSVIQDWAADEQTSMMVAANYVHDETERIFGYIQAHRDLLDDSSVAAEFVDFISEFPTVVDENTLDNLKYLSNYSCDFYNTPDVDEHRSKYNELKKKVWETYPMLMCISHKHEDKRALDYIALVDKQ
jgi:hypothetical protein